MKAILGIVTFRLALGLATLLVISVVIFTAVAMLPGDYARTRLGQSATAETVEAYKRQLGLDRPPVTRYLLWVGGAMIGDFGNSFSSTPSAPRPVGTLIFPRLRNTLFLASFAAVIAVPLAIGLGILAALYRGSAFDRIVNTITLTSISVPEFFVAYILIFVFAVKLPIFPSLSYTPPGASFFTRVFASILPTATLVLVTVAHMMRMTRAALIGVLANPYVETAQLKGLSPARIMLRHALPNAWGPIAAIVAVNLGYLVVGVVVVEVVFVYPGIGQLMVDSVSTRDVPVVQGCALIFGATYVLLNLAADIVAIVTNPRLLHRR
jgi:peptide/nickel transport system permease protein